VPLERVVDGLPVIYVAAIAVQTKRDRIEIITKSTYGTLERCGRDTFRPFTDITIKQDLSSSVIR